MDELVAGRYRIERLVAHGGMAAVYEAEDLELHRRVALKFLARGADPERFEREARASAALDHPGIVRVFDVGDSERGPYLVFELVAGGTLEDRFQAATPLDDAETERIATQVAAALAHAHERGVVHRDLKPANVLLDEAGDVKLADFGIAAARDARTLTESGMVMGTAAYMAPEQAEGGPTTPATDVYSFGVLLYRMLTGRLPFEGDNPVAVARRHVEEAPQPVSALRPEAPARLAAIADSALAKDPAARPADGAALAAALSRDAEPAVPDEPTAAFPAPPPRRWRLDRRGAGVAAVAGALLLTAGVAVAALVSDDPAPAEAPTTADGPTATRTGTSRATTEAGTTRRTTTAQTTEGTTSRPETTRAPTSAPPTTAATSAPETDEVPTTVEVPTELPTTVTVPTTVPTLPAVPG